MLRSTRDSSIATVPHSSIDPSDPSTRDSSVVSWLFIFYSSWTPIKPLVEARVETLVPYPATPRNFRRWRKITDFTSLCVIGYCVGSAIFAQLFLVVIAAATAIVTVFVIAAVVASLLVVIVAIVSPPIVVVGGAFLRR